MVTKELQDKIRAGLVKGEPIKSKRPCTDIEDENAYESEDVRRDI